MLKKGLSLFFLPFFFSRYDIYLECGKLINLKDWFDSFCERIDPEIYKMTTKKKKKTTTTKKNQSTAATSGKKEGKGRGRGKKKQNKEEEEEDEDEEDNDKKPSGSASSSSSSRFDDDDDDGPQRVHQQSRLLGRFLSAIGELQLLGFIAAPSQGRTNNKEIVVKLTVGGKT